jgi:hypothetical protein
MNLKPPVVLRPRTDGGLMTKIFASAIAAMCCRAVRRTAAPSTPRAARSANGVTVKNTAAALLALVDVAASKPLKLAVCATPGIASRSLMARRTTASVRESDEPGGNCTIVMKYPWSWAGMNPPGARQN